MTGVIDTNPIVSRFTLALLEDSGLVTEYHFYMSMLKHDVLSATCCCFTTKKNY